MKSASGSKIRYFVITLFIVVILISTYFISGQEPGKLTLATTTSTYDSGLLDFIIPEFEEEYNVEVEIIAVGTGQALANGREGNVDVLLVHAPEREEEFVNEGYGIYRKKVMYNEFVLVGPESDPAGIHDDINASDALRRIYESGNIFCSRGDDSGTHSKEKTLWSKAGFTYENISLKDNSSWYYSLGTGMGNTLLTTSEIGGYALTDEGTFYSMEDKLDLEILIKGDPDLFNQYSVIPINADIYPNINQITSENFANWITSDRIQDMINTYTKNDKTLFNSNAEGITNGE